MKNEKTKGLTKLGSKKTVYEYNKPNPKLLETFVNKHPNNCYLVPFIQPRDEFTSLCPITKQSDHAKMEIIYVPNINMVESKSLKLYLFSFRNSGEFHEDIVNRIAETLWKLMLPKYLRVYGDFAPRGSLSIKPLVEIWEKDLDLFILHKIERLVTSWDLKNAIR
jgi:7-cyano-7-deazaguanine reductase